jgi:hypothetical protein
MKEVSAKIAEKTWAKLTAMSNSASEKLVEQMFREQPNLSAYLSSVDEEDLNDDEQALMISLGLFFWQAMRQVGGYLPRVSEEAMIRAEEANVAQFEDLPGEGEPDLERVASVFWSCGQTELMKFALVIRQRRGPRCPARSSARSSARSGHGGVSRGRPRRESRGRGSMR